MGITLILLGVGCIIGAIVGGGIKLSHLEIPKFGSVWRQFILALFGLLILVLGLNAHLNEPGQGGQAAEKQEQKNEAAAPARQEDAAAKSQRSRQAAADEEEVGPTANEEGGSAGPAPSAFVGDWRDNYGNVIRFLQGPEGMAFRADTAAGQTYFGVAAPSGRMIGFIVGSAECELSLSAGDGEMTGQCVDRQNGGTEPARLTRM